MTDHDGLFHGTPKEHAAALLAEGVLAPSYWGTLEEAQAYAGSDGLVVRVEPERDVQRVAFLANLPVLKMNQALEEDESLVLPDEADWRGSVVACGSARCEDHVPADWLTVVQAVPLPKRNIPR